MYARLLGLVLCSLKMPTYFLRRSVRTYLINAPLNHPPKKKLTEEIIDRLDEWMHKIDGDQRIARARFEKLNKDVNRVAILLVICFGVSLATIAPAWFATK